MEIIIEGIVLDNMLEMTQNNEGCRCKGNCRDNCFVDCSLGI